jgi:thioredoxin-like negative regulator of GroEL
MRSLIIASLLAVTATPAFAFPTTAVPDPYGAHAIARGDHARMEPRLAQAFAKGDRSPEVLLNLAAIQMKAGQPGTAHDLLRMVLDTPNTDMATLNGSAWSHDLARRAMSSQQLATR